MSGYYEDSKRVIEQTQTALSNVLSNPLAVQRLNRLGDISSDLVEFVYGYSTYSTVYNPDIDSDDEIINWTYPDVVADLSAAIWLLASGYYKAAAGCMRNALDIAIVGLYFQVQLIDHTDSDITCYDLEFGEWDKGDKDTPKWSKIIARLKGRAPVQTFNGAHSSCDVIEELYDQFRKLCGFTHSRAWEKKSPSEPSNVIWMGMATPSFDEEQFERFSRIFEDTVAAIAIAWGVSMQHIVKKTPLGA